MAQAKEEIRKFQQVLVNSGYPLPRYGVDGKWGNETKTAMNQYLADRGFPPQEIPDEIVPTLMNSEEPMRGDGIVISTERLIQQIHDYLQEKAQEARVPVPGEVTPAQPPAPSPSPAQPQIITPLTTPEKKKFPWLWVVLGGVLIIGGGIAIYYLSKRESAYREIEDLGCGSGLCDYGESKRIKKIRWRS